MNIVIPMAGLGERFSKAGFVLPKPLIEVHNKPMYQHAVDCLPLAFAQKVIFIVRRSDFSNQLIENINANYSHLPHLIIKVLDKETQGQAETLLQAADLLDWQQPTLVHNCDTYVEVDFDWSVLINDPVDGAIVLFASDDSRWSYAQLNEEQTLVTDFKEKQVISSHASTGTYYFKKTSELIANIHYAIEHDLKENNEFYLSTVYQLMLIKKQRIKPLASKSMLCFGTPNDLVHSLNQMMNTNRI